MVFEMDEQLPTKPPGPRNRTDPAGYPDSISWLPSEATYSSNGSPNNAGTHFVTYFISEYPEPFNASDQYNSPRSVAWLVCVPLALFVISLVTIIGNSFVIAAYYRDKRIRAKVSNILILNLSITDLLIGIFILPINTIFLSLDRWPFGELVCKAWLMLDYTLCFVSVFTILLISLDRYWLVKKKLKYVTFQTRRRIVFSLAFTWCTCVAFYATMAFGWTALSGRETNVDYALVCEMEFSYSLPMTIALNVVEFIIPFCVIVFLNLVVYCSIRIGPKELVHRKMQSVNGRSYVAVTFLQGRRKPRATIPKRRDHDGGESVASFSRAGEGLVETVTLAPKTDDSTINSQTCNEGIRPTELKGYIKLPAHHRKAALLLGVLVSAFLLCWLPYEITSVRFAFCDNCVPDLTWEITNNLLWCNSVVNPFLYALTNVRFKDNFLDFLCRRKRETYLRSSKTNYGQYTIGGNSPIKGI